MRIKNLHLENFRGFEKLDIEFPEDSNTIVLIGENGSGKTTVLDAIAFLLQIQIFKDYCVGRKDGIIHEKIDVSNGCFDDQLILSMNLELDDSIYQASLLFGEDSIDYKSASKYEVGKSMGKPFFLALYYARKKDQDLEFLDFMVPKTSVDEYQIRNWEILKVNYEKANRPYNNAFGINLIDQKKAQKDFEEWFFNLENNELQSIFDNEDFEFRLPELEIFRHVVKEFFKNFKDLKIDEIKGNREKRIKIFDKANNWIELRKDSSRYRLDQLSAGEYTLLMFVIDITRRLLEISTNPTVDIIKNSGGIILIDEIDLHLHPKWQRNILPALTAIFPNIQFIATTHSPQVLSNIPKGSVFLLENNQLSEKELYTEGRDSNSILQDAFNISEIEEKYKSELQDIYNLIDAGNAKDAQQKLEKLIEKRGENDREVVRMQSYIDFL